MAFLDELKTIEASGRTKEDTIGILLELVKIHERTLLKKHLSEVYAALKEGIKRGVNAGRVEDADGKRQLNGAFSFQSYVYMNLDFEPPFPHGITSELVEEAKKYKDEASIRTRVRIEPTFILEKKRKILFQRKQKCAGIVRFDGDSLWFLQELDRLMSADGIQLHSITAPIGKINRIITLGSYKEKIKCSYIESSKREHTLSYDDANYITIRYSCTF